GTIANSGVLKVGEGELENTLSGTGLLVKTGTGELTLSGDNTYSGLTLSGDNTYSGGTTIVLKVGEGELENFFFCGDIDNSGVLKVGEGELEN
ncbi:hypothetical protein CUR75_24300, partial [Salmonella enterica subsp. enterica serovar Legon]|uniref:autotransporter-associated beta strand repeat-containing protein n=1 Tax=Salmonella enterica TaxID=28901 RepID=UPI000D51B39E